MLGLLRSAIPVLGLVLVFAGCSATVSEVGDEPPTNPFQDDETRVCQPGETDGDLNLYNRPAYIDPELIVGFETTYGVEVIEDFYDSNEELLAKLESGASYDLVVPSDYMVTIMVSEGLLLELQKHAIPNLTNLGGIFADPAYDPGGAHSAAYQWGTTGLGVNPDVLGEEFEPSWALVFDPEIIADYPGGVSLLDDPRQTMGAALAYLGYSINSSREPELSAASRVISSARRYVSQFDSVSYADALTSGRVPIAHGRSGDFLKSFHRLEESSAFTYMIPDEGGVVWTDTMAVPTAADHPCTAHAFIEFILEPENGAALTNWTFYASPNAAAEPFIDADILSNEIIYPSGDDVRPLHAVRSTGEFEISYSEYFLLAKG